MLAIDDILAIIGAAVAIGTTATALASLIYKILKDEKCQATIKAVLSHVKGFLYHRGIIEKLKEFIKNIFNLLIGQF